MSQHPYRISIAPSPFGLGVFAKQSFTSGDPLLEFDGPRLSFRAAVALGPRESYALQIKRDEYILPGPPACYVNHSCVPNTGIRGLVLVALRPIVAGEELFYDYSTTMDEDHWEMVCGCGNGSCRRLIRDFKYLDDRLRSEYLQLNIVLPFIARDSALERSGVFLRERGTIAPVGHSGVAARLDPFEA